MSDNRTRVQKLRAMANQSVSPAEAEVAQRKLATVRVSPAVGQPRRRPPVVPFKETIALDDEGRWDG